MNTSDGKNILITGGSGLIGSRLTEMLLEKGYSVSHLSRKERNDPQITTYLWDPLKNYIEEDALANTDHVVHLAGENLAAHRWTDPFKKQIIESRTQSSLLLKEKITPYPNVKSVICASGIGIYKDENENWLDETSEHNNSFPAITCELWEAANSHYPCRTVILRTGLVLSYKGGALRELLKPFRFGIASYFGDGKFFQSWIHIDDLCKMYIYSIENQHVEGTYNAVAPNPVTNFALTKALQQALHKFSVPFPVPLFILKTILGEQSIIVTEGCRVSSNKIKGEGFDFIYNDVASALNNILNK